MARHLFVCTNARGSGKPACGPRGGDALVAAVQRGLVERGASDALVTPCGCLGPCFDGPNAVIYPDGAWLAGLDARDADAIVECLVGDAEADLARDRIPRSPLAAKLAARPGAPE